MRELKPEQIVQMEFDKLERLVRNFFIDNKNFKPQGKEIWNCHPGFYFREYPTTSSYVRGPLRSQAEFVLEQIEASKSYLMEFVKSE